MNADKIGKFIRELRDEKKWTQEMLAGQIPIVREAVSKWERGKGLPGLDTLKRIAEIFEVSIEEILAGERNPKENITLKLYDERNRIKKKLNTALVAVGVIIILFLGYYFFNQFKSTNIYTITAKNDNFSLDNGVLIKTREKIYANFGKIVSLTGKTIKSVELYYELDGVEKVLCFSEDTDILILDYLSSEEYFVWNSFDTMINNMYIKINYENTFDKIKITFTKDYVNDSLIFEKTKKEVSDSANNDISNEKELNEDIENRIMSTFEKNEEDVYYFSFEKDDKTLYITYTLPSRIINMIVYSGDESLEEYNYYPTYNGIDYSNYQNEQYMFDYFDNSFSCTKGNCIDENNMKNKIKFFITVLNEVL